MKLNYDCNKKVVYLENNDLEKKIICDNYPSQPMLSPNKNLAAYISPLEWEMIGNISLIDLNTSENKIIYQPSGDKLNPKGILWLDNTHLAVILGYAYGTLSVGGNIYILDIKTKKLKQLTNFSSEIQITDIEVNSNILYISGVEYKDKNFLNKEKFSSELNLSLK